ncbi:MAG: ABC transporter substrate-binding protein [Treponema sp.]|jgi:polar amino acid transport system substrate-binding protein|nr:ABC transporter substrate-binding protein [Treponema sp.]
MNRKTVCGVALLAVILTIPVMTGCRSEDPAKDGVLTVATSPDFPPYESIGNNGEYVGFDIDMAYAIGEAMGLKVEIVPTEFDGIITAVSTDKADIGMSGLSVTEERKKSVDFTVNIANEAQVIIVKKGSPIKTPADLAGKRVGSQNGTTGLDLARYDEATIAGSNYKDTMGRPAEGVGYDDCILAAEQVVAGTLDAVIYDYSPCKEIVAQHPDDLVILEDSGGRVIDLYTFYNAYICKKGNGFAGKVNEAIKKLKDSGKMAALFAKYPAIMPADR